MDCEDGMMPNKVNTYENNIIQMPDLKVENIMACFRAPVELHLKSDEMQVCVSLDLASEPEQRRLCNWSRNLR